MSDLPDDFPALAFYIYQARQIDARCYLARNERISVAELVVRADLLQGDEDQNIDAD